MNRATYDYKALGRLLQARLRADPRGYRAIADEVGCAHPLFSKLIAGQPIAGHTLIAITDWLGVDIRTFYSLECFTDDTVKQPTNQAVGKIVTRLREAAR